MKYFCFRKGEKNKKKKKIIKELFPLIERSFDFYRINRFLNVVTTETIISTFIRNFQQGERGKTINLAGHGNFLIYSARQ